MLTNSADPDEMQHDAAFHLGLRCLQKYSIWDYFVCTCFSYLSSTALALKEIPVMYVCSMYVIVFNIPPTAKVIWR